MSLTVWLSYPAFIRSPRGIIWTCLDTDVNNIEYDRMRKTKTTIVLACVMTGCGHFAWMKKFVFFFAWKEACFCFRKMTIGCWHWNWGHVTTRQCTEFVFDNVTIILEVWKVASSQMMDFFVVKCCLVVQQRCKCVILAPLQYNAIAFSPKSEA